MSSRLTAHALVGALAALLLATPAAAQQPAAPPPTTAPAPTYPNVRITGRVQTQFYWFDNRDAAALAGPTSNFLLRAVRLEARGNLAEHIAFVVQPSFEGGRNVDVQRGRAGVRLRDAWVDVRLTAPGAPTTFALRAGQEKRPFGRYELISGANLPSVERGAGRGLVPGSAMNDLFEANGFLSHDVGVSARLTAARERLALRVGAYNGQGETSNDANGAKSFGARATFAATRRLSLGASAYSHDFVRAAATAGAAPDSAARNAAFELDAQWGTPGEPGLVVLGDFMTGRTTAADRHRVRGVDAVAAWHRRLAHPGLLWAWEPVVRVDHSEPDADAGDLGATLVDAGLGLYLTGRSHVRVMVERQSFEEGVDRDPIVGLRTQMTVNF
jgi:hypothetical protein